MQLDLPRAARAANAWRAPRVGLAAVPAALAAPLLAGGAAFALYLTTLAPTVMWYDMGEFATASATLGIAHNTGYPLLILLGKAFTFLPAGDAAFRVNLMSAVFTAGAIALCARTIHDLAGDVIGDAAGSAVGALIGALTLAFASTVWANATWATSYGLNLFFSAMVLQLIFRWRRTHSPATLAAAALAFGLGLCNHRLIVLVAPPAALLLLVDRSHLTPRSVAASAAALALGLSVYAYLPLRAEQQPMLNWAQPANWHTYWAMFLDGQTPAAYWRFDLAGRIGVLWSYPAYDLTPAGLALAALGLAVCAARDRVVAACLALVLLPDALIVETYSIHNVYNYLTPGYLALAVLAGVGAAWTVTAVRRARLRAVRPWLRVAAVSALLALLPLALAARNATRVDRSGDYNAYDFARETLAHLPPRAVVLTDSWTASPLWYVQMVDGARRDVLVSPIFSVPGEDPTAFAREQDASGRPVYVADGLRAPLGDLRRSFSLQPVVADSIERMLVDVLPQPRYRDDLVMTGSLYRLWTLPPDPRVASVPPAATRAVPFPGGVALAGFAPDSTTVDRGTLARFTYYWRGDRPPTTDLSAVTLFFDASGRIASTRGVPAWSQSRTIGEGAVTTSGWRQGDVVRESYYSLVPRSLAPGDYTVRLAVFDAGGDPAAALAAAQRLVTIGGITVR